MEVEYKYRESLKEYTVEENGYYYYMPYTYIELLVEYLKHVHEDSNDAIENWYSNLKDLERKVVSKKPKDQEKLSSIW